MDRSPENREKQKERSNAWKKSNPERHAELAREYRLRNPQKTKAQNQLNYALRMGKVIKSPCEVCGTSERVHAHHHDYSKPYDVKWLCYLCHKAAHPVSKEDKEIKFKGARHAVLLGSANPFSKLDESMVRQIRLLLEMGISQERIAKAYDVSQVHISRIKLNQSWAHLK